MNTASKWTVVIGNGKRMARKWRQLENLNRLAIFRATIFGISINKMGEIVDNEESSSGYDLSFQPDMEAGCY